MRVGRHVEDLESQVDRIARGGVGERVASGGGLRLVEGDAPAVSVGWWFCGGGGERRGGEVRRRRKEEAASDDGGCLGFWPALFSSSITLKIYAFCTRVSRFLFDAISMLARRS